MKKNFLILTIIGALAPFVVFFSALNPSLWGSAFQASSNISPSGESLPFVTALCAQLFVASITIIWAAWNNQLMSSTNKWLVTALTLALSPACGVPLYFYLTWE